MTAKIYHGPNTNHSLKDDNGNIVSSDEEICQLCWEYFNSNYLGHNSHDSEDLILPTFLRTVLTEEDNSSILQIPNEEELRRAVFSINRDKAQGPDGYNARFYQELWPLIKKKICWLLSLPFSLMVTLAKYQLIQFHHNSPNPQEPKC